MTLFGIKKFMKLRGSQNQSIQAKTLTEVIVVVFILGCLLAILILELSSAKRPRHRFNCINCLKEVGLAYNIWSGDNNGQFPFHVSVTNGGAMESVATGNVVAVFQCMSNELSTPIILACPDDHAHSAATNFLVNFTAKNLSYFAGMDATLTQPQSVLSGDANLVINDQPVPPGILNLAGQRVTWSKDRHRTGGNVGMADGSVRMPAVQPGQTLVPDVIVCTNRWVIP